MVDASPMEVRAGSRNAGFSLVELAIVMVIIAIVAAMAVPRYMAGLARYRAEAAARRLVVDLDLARSSARAASEARVLRLEPATHRYTIVGMDHPDRPGTPYTVRLDEEPYHAIIVSHNLGTDAAVTFDGYGQPDLAATITVRSGDTMRTVTLDPTTGTATWQ
jgi:prepilin-type N-terminal cleavage/methylation domain-containing protein